MNNIIRRIAALALVLALVASLSACSDDDGNGGADSGVVDGSGGGGDAGADAPAVKPDAGQVDPNQLPGCSKTCAADEVCSAAGTCVKPLPDAPCGSDKWGGTLPPGNVVYVDGAYSGGGSDGSATKPYTSIADAVAKAPGGSVIAITDGVYGDSTTPLVISKSLTLHCRCPSSVRIASRVVIAPDGSGTAGQPTLVRLARCRVAPAAALPSSAPACSSGSPVGITLSDKASYPAQLVVSDSAISGWCSGIFAAAGEAQSGLCVRRSVLQRNTRGIDAKGLPPTSSSALPGCSQTAGLSVERSRVAENVEAGIFTRTNARGLSVFESFIQSNGSFAGKRVGSTGYGVYHGGVLVARFDRSRISDNEDRGVALINEGRSAAEPITVSITRTVISGNRIAALALQDLQTTKNVQVSDGSRFSGTRVASPTGADGADGIQISAAAGAAYGIDLTASRVEDNGRSGVHMTGVTGSVTGNVIAKNATYGCMLVKSDKVAVSGNTYAQNPSGNVQRTQTSQEKIATLPIPIP